MVSPAAAATSSGSVFAPRPAAEPMEAPVHTTVISSTAASAICASTHRSVWIQAARRGARTLCLQVRNSSLQRQQAASSSGLLEKSSTNVKVRPHEVCVVKPASKVIAGSRVSHFELSNLDLVMLPVTVQVLFFYAGDGLDHRGDVDPAKVMKEALERVLVYYYPLAGRLCVAAGGRPVIECNDAGVAFADADANVALTDLGDLSLPDPAILAPFVSALSPALEADDAPLFTAQVTRLSCGGFVLGLVFRHCLLDGGALIDFMSSWAATVRGMSLSLLPVLDKSFIKARSPLKISYTHGEFLGIEEDVSINGLCQEITSNLVLRSFCFTPQAMENLRRTAIEDGILPSCTAFQALSGLLWQARTTALRMHPEQKVKLVVVFDGRLARGVRFPKGYLGNAITFTSAIASAGELAGSSLSVAAKHVRDAVRRVTGDYVRSQVDYLECGAAFAPTTAATFGISAWAWLPLYDIDFGWGKAAHVVPSNAMMPEGSVFLARGAGRKGVNVLLCQPAQVMERIEELLGPHILPTSQHSEGV